MAKVHFSRPPKEWELEKILSGTGAGAAAIYMPDSCFRRLSAKARKILDRTGAEVVIESAAGRPIALPMEKILQVVEMHKDERTFREIEQATGIPKSTCHYLVKYAQRQKIRKEGRVVYL